MIQRLRLHRSSIGSAQLRKCELFLGTVSGFENLLGEGNLFSKTAINKAWVEYVKIRAQLFLALIFTRFNCKL